MAPALVISQNGELYLHTLFLFPEVVEMELGHWRENIIYHHNELSTTLYLKLNLVTRAFSSENNHCPRWFWKQFV